MYQDVMTAQPIIEAERFILRPLRKSDAGLMALYTGDKRVAIGTRAIPHPLPPGATEAFIARSMALRGCLGDRRLCAGVGRTLGRRLPDTP